VLYLELVGDIDPLQAWSIGALTPSTTLAFYFEIAAAEAIAEGKQLYLQITTMYSQPNGQYKLRVTTQACTS